jgi:hypothetical protein
MACFSSTVCVVFTEIATFRGRMPPSMASACQVTFTSDHNGRYSILLEGEKIMYATMEINSVCSSHTLPMPAVATLCWCSFISDTNDLEI